MGKKSTVRRGWLCVACLAALNTWAAPAGTSPAALEWFVAPTVTTWTSGETPKEASERAEVMAARGEQEAFFLVLRGDGVGEGALIAGTGPLEGPAGVLEGTQVRVLRTLWVEAQGRRIPDALVPLAMPPELVGVGAQRPGEDVPLYVEITVPRSAKPGLYKGAVTVKSAAGTVSVPVALTVLPLTLPPHASLATVVELSARDATLGSGGQTLEDAIVSGLLHRYTLTGLSHRLNLVGGADRAPKYKKIPGEGDLELDFTDFDAEMQAWMDGVGALDGARHSVITLRAPDTLSGIDRLKYALAFQQHLEKKGWGDRLVTFDDSPGMDGRFVPKSLESRRAALCALSECATQKGRQKRWWRISAQPDGVGLGLGARPAHVRAIGWLAFGGGAAGLRYGNAVGGFAEALYSGGLPGEALFYAVKPGASLGPTIVESVRLKLLRDGLEDYEFLQAARAAGQGALVKEWTARIAASPDAVTQDAAAWGRARKALADGAERTARRNKHPSNGKTKPRLPPVPADRACVTSSDGTTTSCPPEGAIAPEVR